MNKEGEEGDDEEEGSFLPSDGCSQLSAQCHKSRLAAFSILSAPHAEKETFESLAIVPLTVPNFRKTPISEIEGIYSAVSVTI